jgi:glycerophosphoryl diester phosphodiesterase
MLTAFLRSVELGADVIEMDLQITKDDHVVVAHDANLKQECLPENSPKKDVFFRDLKLAEVKTFDCGSRVRVGQPVPGEKISTLAEILKETRVSLTHRGRPLGYNIEIKYNPTQPQFYPSRSHYVDLLLKVLDESKIENSRLLVQSFDVEILRVLREKRPEIRISPLLSDVKDGLQIAQMLKTDLITPHVGQLSPQMLEAFHKAGVQVIPWTVNTLEEVLRVIELGADGAITDHADLFRMAQRMCMQ